MHTNTMTITFISEILKGPHGEYKMIGLIDDAGDRYKTYISPRNRNYKGNWKPALEAGIGTLLGGIIIKNKAQKLVDADSRVEILKSQEPVDDDACFEMASATFSSK